MCIIVDTNVRHEVFGTDQSKRGRVLFDWLTQGRTGPLVVGGRLRRELVEYGMFRTWLSAAILAGLARRVEDSRVDAEAKAITAEQLYRSDDEHVIALARISGARLLFTDDQALERDFKDRKLITNPRGKIYKSSKHHELLTERHLCRTEGT